MKIAVEGRLESGSYEDRDGRKVNTVEIIVENQEFCEKKTDSVGNHNDGIPHEEDPFGAYGAHDDYPFQ